MEKINVIIRKTWNEYHKEYMPMVFIIDSSARYGRITVFDHEGHNEASLEYYWNTKPASSDEFPEFWKYFLSVYDDVEIVIKKRINHDKLRENWYYY